MQDVSLNTKLEIAVEIIAAKIAITTKQGFNAKDEPIKKLMKEREEMYNGNEIIINKIIKEYGPEIKEKYEGT